jgi:glycosyltransferase involved in cell wall biosynthesis
MFHNSIPITKKWFIVGNCIWTSMNRKISIITSLYNISLADFQECYVSVVRDNYFEHCEWIIVDDGFNMLDLINFLSDCPKVTLIRNEENLGLTKSLNRALDLAQGEIIVRIDHDDYFIKDRLQKIYFFFQENQSFVLRCSGYNEQCGKFFRTVSEPTRRLYFRDFIWRNPVLHSSVAFRSQINGVKTYYNPSYRYSQDFDLWLRLLQVGNLQLVSDVEVTRNVLQNGISMSNLQSQIKTATLCRIQYLNSSKKIYLLPLLFLSAMYFFVANKYGSLKLRLMTVFI